MSTSEATRFEELRPAAAALRPADTDRAKQTSIVPLRRKEPAGRPTVSVLMSTYAGEIAENLDQSLQSIARQTVLPDQVVLVVDGPIDARQQEVIRGYAQDHGFPQMTVVTLPSSQGLAGAMNQGLRYCKSDYIMRMDSDDICAQDRLELQLDFVKSRPETDIVSSWSEEFFGDGARPQLKVSPVGHDAIVRALRWRNVLVHPTVLVRAETLRAVGGYRGQFQKLEDYDLFVRLTLHGAKFHVIPKVLVRVRSSIGQRSRRGGLGHALSELRFRAACLGAGFINLREFLLITLLYLTFRLASPAARRRLYALARS
jgi:glycosyltransferase involved in cell wall biosynthesis